MKRPRLRLPQDVDPLELSLAVFYLFGALLAIVAGPDPGSFAAQLNPMFRVGLLSILVVGAGIVLLSLLWRGKALRLFLESYGLFTLGVGSIVYGAGLMMIDASRLRYFSGATVIWLGLMFLVKRRQVEEIIEGLPRR